MDRAPPRKAGGALMPRWFAPEVVQTSAMDCGPAALKTLLEGFGIHASYGRLREACQTDVDGTSTDALEEAAVALGLDAAQIMMPADHLFLPGDGLLPALVVVRQPDGVTHFVVVWRRTGGFLQVMDPAVGRRWVAAHSFLETVYRHTHSVPVDSWIAWAHSEAFRDALENRMRRLGFSGGALLDQTLARDDWQTLAALDAAIRMAEALVAGRAIRRGKSLKPFVTNLALHPEGIPQLYWSVREDAAHEGHLLFSGAVLIQVRGRVPRPSQTLPPELEAALQEAPPQPGRELLRMVLRDSRLAPWLATAAVSLSAAGSLLQALLFRSLFDIGRDLRIAGQRWWVAAALLGLLACLLLLEIGIAALQAKMGRKLEIRLRAAILHKIPLLGDRYFRSRLTSDMAERSHTLHRLRDQPALAVGLLRPVFDLTFTVCAIFWLFPASGPLAAVAAGLAIGIPLLAQPGLATRDLRARSHNSALAHFQFDALLGRIPIRTHGAEASVRNAHDSLLGEWARATRTFQRAVAAVEGFQLMATLAIVSALLFAYVGAQKDPGALLVLVYWALRLPLLGQVAASLAWRYPGQRNITLRLFEPLGTPEEPESPGGMAGIAPQPGVALAFENVAVCASGHTILSDINLRIEPGEHIGIVGPSGAGKSTLIGLLLGWHRAAEGRISVDGAPLAPQSLRREIAWVDPQVQLWNRPLLDNLQYGSDGTDLEGAIDSANLRGVIARLPEGMQSALGEGGALVSGGEGQRVRLGRAMLKPGVRLALLDELARGLDRGTRRVMLDRARETWRQQTILAVTHDVSDTLDLPRVLVVEQGRIVEDGNPRVLAGDPDSRFRALLNAEDAVRRGLWSSAMWRRVRISEGKLAEQERMEVACRN
ncbi:MAG: ABC transporter permease [Terriglobia bacterium]|nr:MAG: ABC transporter permease [Terriglobia bacterium]